MGVRHDVHLLISCTGKGGPSARDFFQKEESARTGEPFAAESGRFAEGVDADQFGGKQSLASKFF
jgi:hypothetical protein